jgi:putative resolvase
MVLNWFPAGTLPVPARQVPAGTIVVGPRTRPVGATVAYCRVWSADRRDGLERRARWVAQERGKRGSALDSTVTGIGSGLDGTLVELGELLANPQVGNGVVGHRDRVGRFGVDHREAALAADRPPDCRAGPTRTR